MTTGDMVNVKPELVAALKGDAQIISLLGGPFVYFQYPEDETQYPRITYYELDNKGFIYADNEEKASQIYIMVDIWSKESTSALASAVNIVMKSLGYVREFAADLFETDTKVFHKPMRFRIEKEV